MQPRKSSQIHIFLHDLVSKASFSFGSISIPMLTKSSLPASCVFSFATSCCWVRHFGHQTANVSTKITFPLKSVILKTIPVLTSSIPEKTSAGKALLDSSDGSESAVQLAALFSAAEFLELTAGFAAVNWSCTGRQYHKAK